MTARLAGILVGSLMVATSVPGMGQEAADAKVRVQLVSSSNTTTGDDPYLGVRFDIEPGWHIYWKHPGGAGMSTEVRWRLPDGIEAGELQWPLPVFFFQSGEIPGYGYEGSVVLASKIRAASLPGGATRVGAEVSWLACKDVCVLGSAELEVPWDEVAADKVFEGWGDRLPMVFEEDAPFTLSTTGGLGDGKLSLWLRWSSSPLSVDWFPEVPEGLVVEDVVARTRAGLTRIDAAVRRMAGAAGEYAKLPSLLVVTDENGRRRGWSIALDLGAD